MDIEQILNDNPCYKCANAETRNDCRKCIERLSYIYDILEQYVNQKKPGGKKWEYSQKTKTTATPKK